MLTFLVASTVKCIEVEASSIENALSIGKVLLKEDWKYGYCRAIEKNSNLEEMRRKLSISYGEDFEYFGSPDHTLKILKEYVENLIKNENHS